MLEKAIYAAASSHVPPKTDLRDFSYEARQRLWLNIKQEYQTEGLMNDGGVIDLEKLRTKSISKSPEQQHREALRSLEQEYQEALDAYLERFGHGEKEQTEKEAGMTEEGLRLHRIERTQAAQRLHEIKTKHQDLQKKQPGRHSPAVSGARRPSR